MHITLTDRLTDKPQPTKHYTSNTRKAFILNTPTPGATKNWISQGLVAEMAVVIAQLILEDGTSMGPHAFYMRLRDKSTGQLVPGVAVEDMGRKTEANDLDNASISFANVELPCENLLRRFSDVNRETGAYIQTTDVKMRIEVIGQRLLTGRMAIAEAGLVFARTLYQHSQHYADHKRTWAPAKDDTNGPPLSAVPHIAALFQEADERLSELEHFASGVRGRLETVLRKRSIPDADLVEAIGAAKVECITVAMDLCFRLKMELGSYALMMGSGFEHLDFLSMCAFAEGDTKIIMLKMARDRLKAATMGRAVPASSKEESALVSQLQNAMSQAMERGGPAAAQTAWNANFRTVFALAHAIVRRHVTRGSGPVSGKAAL